ncbi:MAG: phosphoribosyltransferase family protein [Patescibacteria group bacterium]
MFSDFFHHLTDLIYPKNPLIKRLETLGGTGLLKELPASKLSHINMRAVFAYKDKSARALIWEIKYRANKKLLRSAAEAMLLEIGGVRPENGLFLIPIPMHKDRRRVRGFNQSALLVEAMLEKDTSLKNGEGLIEKVRKTQPQSTLQREERRKNLAGAFRVVDSKAIAGREFLLVDDVTTTGTTFAEISKVLKEAGAKKISALALAH